MAKNKIAEMKKVGNRMEAGREARLAAIQELIPIALTAVSAELQREVSELAGPRYGRGGEADRWGSNGGSVFIGDQKVRIRVPRVRRRGRGEEITLGSYQRLQEPGLIEECALKREIRGISTGNYEGAAISVPATFGIKRNSVSRLWIRASARKLRELQERSLKDLDIVALVMDGKYFGDNEVIVAVGILLNGRKTILGIVEASTERYEVCRDFLNGLINRGLSIEHDMLVALDGGKGLRKAVKVVLGEKGHVQRCQWHKRENVVSYLPKERQEEFRNKLQAGYEKPTYDEAKKRLLMIRAELKTVNLSAVTSLDEGFEETLTLHRLGMFEELGVSLKTTNIVENINGLLERRTARVTRWRTSNQRQRWVATALLEIEPRLRTTRGHRHLPAIRRAMRMARLNIQDARVKQAA